MRRGAGVGGRSVINLLYYLTATIISFLTSIQFQIRILYAYNNYVLLLLH